MRAGTKPRTQGAATPQINPPPKKKSNKHFMSILRYAWQRKQLPQNVFSSLPKIPLSSKNMASEWW